MRLKDYLTIGTAILTLGVGSLGLESKVYGEEKVAQWREVKKALDLTSGQALKIKDSEKAWILSICEETVDFTNYKNNPGICYNMWKVIDILTEKFFPKIQFGKFDVGQLAEKGMTEYEIMDFLRENFNISVPDKIATTIMYKAGRFKSLREKEFDRRSCGPKTDGDIENFVYNMSWWINYNLLGIKQEEDKDKNIIVLYRGTCKAEGVEIK